MNQVIVDEIIRLSSTGLAPRAILYELLKPSTISTTTTVNRDSAALEVKFKGLVVGDLMTAGFWNNNTEIARDDKIELELEQRLGATGITDAQFIAASKLKARLDLLRSRIDRIGGTDTGIDSTLTTKQVTTVSSGPSWIESNVPGEREPTIEDVRAVIRRGA